MTPNLFHDRLDGLTYEDVFVVLAAINEETARLEFKRELDVGAVTQEVIALANAEGGLIVIGFEDPEPSVALRPFSTGPDTSDAERRRLMSRVQAKIYPNLSLEIRGFNAADASHRMLLLRVPASPQAPHESLNNRGRFPVRRGTQTDYLTLREIEYLLARRDGDTNAVASQRSFPHLSFDRIGQDLFVGARLIPEHASPVRVLTKSLQQPIEGIVRSLPGLEKLAPATEMEGVVFVDGSLPKPADTTEHLSWLRHRQRCYVSVDGMIEIRFPQDTSMLIYQIYRPLCDAYAAASEILLILGNGSRVSGTFAYHLQRTRDLGPFPIGDSGELYFDCDLSRDTPLDVFPELLIHAMRQAGELSDYEEFSNGLERFWTEQYLRRLGIPDLRDRWH